MRFSLLNFVPLFLMEDRLRGVLEQVKQAENCVDKCEDEYKSVVTWLDVINIYQQTICTLA